MRRKAAIVVALVGLVLAAAIGAGGTSAAPERSTATNLTIWVGWSARELSEFKKVVAEYDSKNADVTVKVVGAINDDKITAALRSGNVPYDTELVYDKESRRMVRAPVNPFLSAMVVHNPTVKRETPKREEDYAFLKKLNSEEEYNLLKSRKPWTLAIKQYNGLTMIKPVLGEKKGLLERLWPFSNDNQGEMLNAAAHNAHELAKTLRQLERDGDVLPAQLLAPDRRVRGVDGLASDLDRLLRDDVAHAARLQELLVLDAEDGKEHLRRAALREQLLGAGGRPIAARAVARGDVRVGLRRRVERPRRRQALSRRTRSGGGWRRRRAWRTTRRSGRRRRARRGSRPRRRRPRRRPDRAAGAGRGRRG